MNNSHQFVRALVIGTAMMILTACVTVPASLQSNEVNMVSLQTAKKDPALAKGKNARWGGLITQVVNNENNTWVEILALELNSSARPIEQRNNNMGRFIAEFPEFLDPAVYEENRLITVVGLVDEPLDGKIGDYNYTYPRVIVQAHHLWSKTSRRPMPAPGIWHRHYLWPYWYGFEYGPYYRDDSWRHNDDNNLRPPRLSNRGRVPVSKEPFTQPQKSNVYRPSRNTYRPNVRPSRPNAGVQRPARISRPQPQRSPVQRPKREREH